MIRGRHSFITLLVLALLAGCGEAPQEEKIEARLYELRTRPQGKIEALPRFPEPVIAQYRQQDQRDPFTPNELLARRFQTGDSLLRPDANRPKTTLEQWGLDELTFRGTLQKGSEIRALILAPDNQLFAVQVGDRLGRDHGTIREIQSEQIRLVELIPDGNGQWQERQQLISLSR